MSGAINREKFNELLGRYKKLSELERKKLMRKMVAFNPSKREYSVTNKCLLAMQKGLVGQYGGFRAWIKLGKAVKKGEKGFLIATPIISKEESEKPENERRISFFKHTSVFHISQTEPLTPTPHAHQT